VHESAPGAKIALLSAASGPEISGPSPDAKHGLFSSALLDALATGAADTDGDGRITLKELTDWVKPRVVRGAKQANREQHPALVSGRGMGAPENVAVEWGLATR
jgi:hypothetical protein